jgi:hypothetical protein
MVRHFSGFKANRSICPIPQMGELCSHRICINCSSGANKSHLEELDEQNQMNYRNIRKKQ